MKLKLKDKIFIGLVIVGLVFAIINRWNGHPSNDNKQGDSALVTIAISGHELKVKEVATDEDMYKGLGGRESMDEGEGMLFLHMLPGRYKYVMRDMRFNLDFIFIRGNEVVDFAEKVEADFQGSIQGAIDYDSVLEVNSGWIEKNGIKLGDKFERKN